MSGHPCSPVTLSRRIRVEHRRVVTGLRDLLDLELGLADARLSDELAVLTHDLTEVLDVRKGLDAILPDPLPPTDSSATAFLNPPDLVLGGHRFVFLTFQRLAAAVCGPDVETRLLLRIHQGLRPLPSLLALALHLVALTELSARLVSMVEARDPWELSNDLDLTLTRDLARDLALDLALDRAANLDLERARESARDLGNDIDVALGLATVQDHDLAQLRRHVRDLQSPLEVAKELLSSLGTASDRARDLARAYARDLAVELDRSRYPALVRCLEDAVTVDLDADRDRARSLAADRVVTFALDYVLDRDVAALQQAPHDFTNADLRRLDLIGIDLTGVRWSKKSTRWPPRLAPLIEQLSVAIADGIWEIREGGGRPVMQRLVPA